MIGIEEKLTELVDELRHTCREDDWWDFKETHYEDRAALLHDIICLANNRANRDAYLILASRIVCGDCGAFYGSKVWHSTDEYRRTIWRCNNKYEGDKKCSTPHVTQDELEKAFVSVMQKVIAEKDAIFTVCREVLDEVLETSELDRIATQMQEQTMQISVRARRLVEENARVRRNQEEYQREYDALASEHEKLSRQMQDVEEQRKDKADRRWQIEIFLRMLEEQEERVGFDPYTFVALIDKVTVFADGRLVFCFRNGVSYDF